MSEFDNREEAFERRFAVDEEIAFKALARRNRLLGQWLAELVGLTDAADKLVCARSGSIEAKDLERFQRALFP